MEPVGAANYVAFEVFFPPDICRPTPPKENPKSKKMKEKSANKTIEELDDGFMLFNK